MRLFGTFAVLIAHFGDHIFGHHWGSRMQCRGLSHKLQQGILVKEPGRPLSGHGLFWIILKSSRTTVGLHAKGWYVALLAKMFAFSGSVNLHSVGTSLYTGSITCGSQMLWGSRTNPAIQEISPMRLDRTVGSAQLASSSPTLWIALLAHIRFHCQGRFSLDSCANRCSYFFTEPYRKGNQNDLHYVFIADSRTCHRKDLSNYEGVL